MKPMPRVRWLVVLMAVVINMVCYTDRVCIAVAGPELRKATFGFSIWWETRLTTAEVGDGRA